MISSPEWRRINPAKRQIITNHQYLPPVPVGSIAKDLGLKLSLATLKPGISGEIRRVAKDEAPSEFSIRVNKHEPKYRQRFTIAHEIGHYLLHAEQITDYLTDDVLYRSKLSNKLEAEANRLATDILMPIDLITKYLVELPTSTSPSERAKQLSEIFQVSEIAMAIRLGIPASQ